MSNMVTTRNTTGREINTMIDLQVMPQIMESKSFIINNTNHHMNTIIITIGDAKTIVLEVTTTKVVPIDQTNMRNINQDMIQHLRKLNTQESKVRTVP